MSIISEKVRTAIFSKTNVSAVVGSGKLSAIYEGKALAGAIFPYGIFNRQASEPVVYAFNVTQILEGDFWQFRVYAESQSVAETLLNTWITTLGTSLTLTGNTVGWCARVNDLPPTDQQLNDRFIYGRGALVLVKTGP
jgi:hypothetical protein